MKKSKRRNDSWIGALFFLAIGAACGFALSRFVEITGATELSFGKYLLIMAGLAITLYAAIFLQIIIHETGHLVFGLATGYRFSSFRIASLMLVKTEGGMRLRRLSLAGTGGQCLLSPPEANGWRFPYALYNLGGSIANLISAAIFAALLPACGGLPYLRLVLEMLSAAGAGFALVNGIPLHMGAIDNDGCNALSLGKTPEALRSFWIQMKVNELQTNGVRLRDMPAEWFRMPESGELSNSMVAVEAVLCENRLMDERRFDEAAKLIDRLAAMETGITGLHMGLLRCDRIYCGLLAGEDIASLRTKEQRRFERQMRNYLTVVRTEYVRLLYDGDAARAESCRVFFERVAKSYPFSAEAAAERGLMELALAAVNAQGRPPEPDTALS